MYAQIPYHRLNVVPAHELEFRDMVESAIPKNRERYHDKFQLGCHYIPDDEPLKLTPPAVHIFLESVHNESAYFVRLNRAIFESKKALIEIWTGNPVLTSVIFGLPMGFLSLILYSVFCGDCLVTDEDDDDEHEKNE